MLIQEYREQKTDIRGWSSALENDRRAAVNAPNSTPVAFPILALADSLVRNPRP
jgi:hypothetical protein